MKLSRVVLFGGAILLIGAVAFLAYRSRVPVQHAQDSGANLAYLAVLNSDQALAKVGLAQLRGTDLRDAMQMELHGKFSHASLDPQELSRRISAALDRLVEDELLAQEAKKRGLKTELNGAAGRQDLAAQLLKQEHSLLPPVTDQDLRTFYGNHGEKFHIPPGIQVRELFLPLQEPGLKKGKTDPAAVLARQLADRIRKGESLQKLAQEYAAPADRQRADGYLFRGGVMEPADELAVLGLRPGQIAGPIRVEGGYSIFECLAQERSRRIPFYEAQEKIRGFLEERQREEMRKKLVERLRQRITVQRFEPEAVIGEPGPSS